MIFATGLHICKKKFWILIQHFYFYSFLTYSEHIRKCSKLQIMIVFPILIPGQNFLFPGTGRENLKCHGKGRDGKFEACIPGNHGKREFPLTPGTWDPHPPCPLVQHHHNDNQHHPNIPKHNMYTVITSNTPYSSFNTSLTPLVISSPILDCKIANLPTKHL